MSKSLVLAATAVVTVVVLLFWGKLLGPAQRQPVAKPTSFVPDPNSDKRIALSGWAEGELERILEDFAKIYELDTSFATQVRTAASDSVLISFPNGIPSDLFFFLVNYLNYPERYELSDRQIAVAGKATLTRAFELPDSSLLGKSATVYVPEDDEEFDLVYVTLQSGESFEISFTDHGWKRVQEARMSRAVQDL